MKKQRKHYAPEEKVILRRHLPEKEVRKRYAVSVDREVTQRRDPSTDTIRWPHAYCLVIGHSLTV